MDISEIAASETFKLHLEHPVLGRLYNDKEPVTITIYGPDSAFAREQRYKAVNKQMNTNKDQQTNPQTAEQIFEDGNKILAERVLAVSGLSMGGKPVTPDNIIEVLSDYSQGWLREQLDRATVNRSLFFGNA